MKQSHLIKVLFVSPLLLTAVACGSSDGGGDSGGTIGLAAADLGAPFFQAVSECAENKGDEEGYTVDVQDAQGDSAKQVNQVQTFVTQQVDGVIFIPAGAAASDVPVTMANDADIPIVALDRKPSAGEVLTFIASDSVNAAAELGEFYVEAVDGKGELAVLQGQSGTTPELDRKKGFEQALEGTDVQIVAEQAADWNREKGYAAAQQMLQAHPGLRGFFGRSDDMAIGAASAAKQAGVRDQLVIVGFDGLPDGLDAVKNGDLDATMTQQACKMGELAVENLIAAADGEAHDIPEEQLLPAVLTTEDNVDEVLAEKPYGPLND